MAKLDHQISDQFHAAGLSNDEAALRLELDGPNTIEIRRTAFAWRRAWGQIQSPITLMLIFSAALALGLGDRTEAILIIIIASATLGWWQERRATNIVKKLMALIQTKPAR